MSDEAEKAFDVWVSSERVLDADPRGQAHKAFMAGWHARDALIESQARLIAALTGSLQDVNIGWDKTLEQLAEREAVIDAVDDWFNGLGDAVCPDGERLARLLDASPSAVLAEHDARVWDEGWSARASRAHLKVGECVPAPAHINPYWKGAGQ